jgi:hypothetical protein
MLSENVSGCLEHKIGPGIVFFIVLAYSTKFAINFLEPLENIPWP